ncbi:delta-9 fatty acid desaturase [Phyllosticta citricarpa]
MGWILMKQNPKRIGRTDISDLNEDPVVVFQHRHYVKCALFMGIAFPALVSGLLWNDWIGGLVYAGILRIFFVQQATFCINSLAHWIGEQPFDDKNSPRDHWITALATLGEGYHNFHHEFPSDYRNAIEWWQYDPTKWFIWAWKQVGLAYDLKQFRQYRPGFFICQLIFVGANEIEKGRLQMSQKKLDRARATLDWGIPLDQLPVISWDEYVERSSINAEHGQKRAWILVAGVVHDVTDFISEHPGGRALIKSYVGKDATAAFNGGVYEHSNAAHNLLSTMRVGIVKGGMEVEIWKREAGVEAREGKRDEMARAQEQVTRVRARN